MSVRVFLMLVEIFLAICKLNFFMMILFKLKFSKLNLIIGARILELFVELDFNY